MNGFGNCQIVVPGFGKSLAVGFQYVFPVVNHLEVAIDHQQLGLAADFLAEFAEVTCNVSKVNLGVLGDIGVEVCQQASGIQFNPPTSSENANVNRVGTRGPVCLDLLEDFSERHFGYHNLGTCHGFKFLATFGQTAGNDRAWARQNVDGYAIIFTRDSGGSQTANSHTGEQGASDQRLHFHMVSSHFVFVSVVLTISAKTSNFFGSDFVRPTVISILPSFVRAARANLCLSENDRKTCL